MLNFEELKNLIKLGREKCCSFGIPHLEESINNYSYYVPSLSVDENSTVVNAVYIPEGIEASKEFTSTPLLGKDSELQKYCTSLSLSGVIEDKILIIIDCYQDKTITLYNNEMTVSKYWNIKRPFVMLGFLGG